MDKKATLILYADDDPDDRFFFQEALNLAESKAQLIVVKDGRELLEYIEGNVKELPDIIFLDINMPYYNGKQCLKRIRDNAACKKIPVVMFSTSSHSKDIEETFLNGASLYVSKPVFFEDQIVILRKIFALNWKVDLINPTKERFLLHS